MVLSAAMDACDPAAGGERSMNRELEAKARAATGLKAYITNMVAPSPGFVNGAYRQLWHIEKSSRMSKHDLRARPIYHHKRESIEADLYIVFAALVITRCRERQTALAITRFVEDRTGWSIKKFVRTTRRYRSVQIRVGEHTSPPRTRYRPICAPRSLRSPELSSH